MITVDPCNYNDILPTIFFFKKSCLQGFVSRQIRPFSVDLTPLSENFFLKIFQSSLGVPDPKIFLKKNFALQDFGSRQIRSFPVVLTPLLETLF